MEHNLKRTDLEIETLEITALEKIKIYLQIKSLIDGKNYNTDDDFAKHILDTIAKKLNPSRIYRGTKGGGWQYSQYGRKVYISSSWGR